MNLPALVADAVALVGKIPQPLQDAAIDLAKTVWHSLADGDDPAETARKAKEALLSLETAQRAMKARMQHTTPRYQP